MSGEEFRRFFNSVPEHRRSALLGLCVTVVYNDDLPDNATVSEARAKVKELYEALYRV